MTDRPAGKLAILLVVNTHVTLVHELGRTRMPTSASQHTRVLSLPLHAPAVDCPRNDNRASDGGAFMYLY